MSNSTLSPSVSIECPKCGKHTIVEQPTGTFRCIACDFKRDFSRDDYSSKGRGGKKNRHQKSDRRKSGSEEENVNPFPLMLIGGILLILLV